MIVGAAVCPHPPLLLRELTGGQDVGESLREACGAALSTLMDLDPELIVVVGGADTTGEHESTPVSVGPYGGFGPPGSPEVLLPLSLGIGRRLLDENNVGVPVEMIAVAWDASGQEIGQLAKTITDRPERVGLLVMGDGSARRGEKAPGHLDERAFDFDEIVCWAMAEGDPDTLRMLNADLAMELMVAGRSAWQIMAESVAGGGARVRAELLYADDPFGVMYLVAVWSCVSS